MHVQLLRCFRGRKVEETTRENYFRLKKYFFFVLLEGFSDLGGGAAEMGCCKLRDDRVWLLKINFRLRVVRIKTIIDVL